MCRIAHKARLQAQTGHHSAKGDHKIKEIHENKKKLMIKKRGKVWYVGTSGFAAALSACKISLSAC